jgi:hypothetical protein
MRWRGTTRVYQEIQDSVESDEISSRRSNSADKVCQSHERI